MKKNILFLTAILTMSMLFTACESGEKTVLTDNTKLWPAYSPSTEKYGYINAKGEMEIAPMFDAATSFSCGYALVLNGDQQYFIDKKGQMQQATFDEANHFYNDYARFELNDRYGLLDTKLEFAVQPIYMEMGNMGDGLAPASLNDDKIGFIDKKGKMVIPETYSEVGNFNNGLAPVSTGNKWGCINKSNTYIIQPIYDRIWSFQDGMAMFERNDKIGFFNTKGDEAIPAMYDDAKSFFENGLAPVEINDKWGYVNKKGNLIIPQTYDVAYSFSEGLAVVGTVTGNSSLTGIQETTFSVINTKGEIQFVFPEGYSIGGEYGQGNPYFHNGLLLIYGFDNDNYEYNYRYIDKKGTIVYQWSIKYNYGVAPDKAPAQKDQRFQQPISKNYRLSK